MDTIKGKIVSLQEQLERFHNVGDSEWLQQAALSSLQAIEHTTKIAWDYQHRLENIMRIRDITDPHDVLKAVLIVPRDLGCMLNSL